MSEPAWSARPVLRSSPDGAATPGEEALAIDAAHAGQLRLWAWCRDGRFSTFA
ncbi:hypothetical protein [Aquabacterium sp.]|uniref:hypothetical protein n=1 Tax=Aquabacterium sp. TaxID=1872578 RepID=UPI00199ED19A|nr:hypothetical protein [Aquabacterium sp.]MBC7699001.1 hypothetical protein [Aquabacterium sp.]